MSKVIHIPYLGPEGDHKGKIEVMDIKKQTYKAAPLREEIKKIKERVARLESVVWALVTVDIAVAAMVIHLVTK